MAKVLLLTNDMIKYIIVIGLIYYIIKIIPTQQISNQDMILILATILIGIFYMDCVM